VGTCAEPESNGASDQDMVSKSADEVQEKHTEASQPGGEQLERERVVVPLALALPAEQQRPQQLSRYILI